MQTEPLFHDVDHALRFAFAIVELQVCSSPAYVKQMVQAQAARSPRLADMTQQDWHAQGQLIRSRILRLDPLLAFYAYACYCWGPERPVAVEAMEGHVRKMLPTLKNDLLRTLLVRRYVDRGRTTRPGQSEIAAAVGMHHSSVQEWERRVKGALGDVHNILFDLLDRQFADAGLIPQPETA